MSDSAPTSVEICFRPSRHPDTKWCSADATSSEPSADETSATRSGVASSCERMIDTPCASSSSSLGMTANPSGTRHLPSSKTQKISDDASRARLARAGPDRRSVDNRPLGRLGTEFRRLNPARILRGAPPVPKYVYDFSEGNRDMKDLLGGKGANLAEMTNLGLPVPPGLDRKSTR